MKLMMIIFAAFVLQSAAPVFAQSWSGFLVSSDCYESEERNVSPFDTEIYVNRDRDSEIRYCFPNAKTKSFTLVDRDGMSFNLEPSGNTKVAEVVRRAGKKDFLKVTVTGEMSKNTIRLNSISTSK